MGQRSRKRGRRARPSTTPRSTPGATAVVEPKATPPPTSRSEQRNAALRATLTPYAPDERPWPIRISCLVAVLIGAQDVIGSLVGSKISLGSAHSNIVLVLLFGSLMLICAVGMWKMRYWAVLGFMTILAGYILFFALLLIRASNLLGFAVAIVVVLGGGWLFYKLVRVLSRLQMPRPPGSEPLS